MVFTARMTDIMSTTRTLANEAGSNVVDGSMLLAFVNQGIRDIARGGYFKRELGIDVEVGVDHYDLGIEIADIVDVFNVRWAGLNSETYALTPCRSLMELRRLGDSDVVASGLEYYYVQGNTLYVWPAPNMDVDEGLIIYHSYLPAALTDLPEGWNSEEDPDPSLPPIPKPYDDALIYYSLYCFFARDMTSPDAPRMGAMYYQAYKKIVASLNHQASSPALAVVPYR